MKDSSFPICSIRVLIKLACNKALVYTMLGSTLFLSQRVSAQTTINTVVPNQARDREGSAGMFLSNRSEWRIQNLYPASQIIESAPFGGTITHIAFRLDGPDGNSVDAVCPAFEVRMTTTPSAQLVFGTPFLPNENVVFERGLLHLKSDWISTGPNEFSILIPLTKPMVYSPQFGNLLVDLFLYEAIPQTTILDTALGGFTSSRVEGGIGAPISAPFSGPTAPVIQLTIIPVPEPSLIILFLIGNLAYCCRRRRTR